jgi:replicative DNA helicase
VLWRGVEALAAAQEPIDSITLADHLHTGDELERAGGFGYITQLARDTPSAANAAAYARAVLERAIAREWIQAFQDMTADLYSTRSYRDTIGRCQALVTQLSSEADSGQARTYSELLPAMMTELEERLSNPGIKGLCLGFKHIDFRLGGLQPGQLVVIGARPSMGKSAYTLNIKRHAKMDGQRPARCHLFSLEMTELEIMERQLSAAGPVKSGLMKSGKVLQITDSAQRLSAAVAELNVEHLSIDETPSLTVEDIAARSRRLHRQNPLDMIMVDHLGLVKASNPRATKTDSVGHVTRSLKLLAKELGIVVFVLSQLNRGVESRPNKRPVLSDLRDSGAIEEDADVIQFLYRGAYYDEGDADDTIEVNTAKLRRGKIGTDYLNWEPHYQRLESRTQAGADATYEEWSEQHD